MQRIMDNVVALLVSSLIALGLSVAINFIPDAFYRVFVIILACASWFFAGSLMGCIYRDTR